MSDPASPPANREIPPDLARAGAILEAFKPGTAPPDSFSGGDGASGANQMNSSHVDQSVGSGTGGLY